MPEPFHTERYRQLLLATCPMPIDTPEEHDRLLSLAEGMLDKGEGMTPEERKLAELLVILIETYESQVEADEDEDDGAGEPPAPHETLSRLLAARHLEAPDIEHLFGNIRLAREALAGRREITGRQAKDLARFFQVPAALFRR